MAVVSLPIEHSFACSDNEGMPVCVIEVFIKPRMMYARSKMTSPVNIFRTLLNACLRRAGAADESIYIIPVTRSDKNAKIIPM